MIVTKPYLARATAAALLLAGAVLLAGCGGDAAKHSTTATDARPVRVAPVEIAPLGSTVRAVGLLAPKDEARLSFKLGGVIDSIRVEEGAAVKHGQVLASLKQAEIGSTVEQARQAAAKARRDLERAKSLYADGVATEEQVQDLGTAYEVAAAALRSAEFNAQYARIEAPADGVVLRRLADANELVQAGQPVLVVGGTERGWIVKTALADRDVVNVAVGDLAEVTFDAFPGRTFAGRVRNVSSAADPMTGTFPIEVQVDGGDAKFVQGLVAKLGLVPKGAQIASAPVVPLPALVEASGDSASVYVLDPATSTVKRTVIRTGRIGADRIEVVSGVRPGQQIVVEGAAFLEDGEAVRLAPAVVAEAR